MDNKFHALQPWLHEILGEIRRDIKTDYLPGSASFYRKHFGNRPQNRLTAEEINAAFIKELVEGNDDLAEWVVNRWVFKHGELYSHFAERLVQIRSDFAAIETLTAPEADQVLAGAKESFGAKRIYFFSILNDVVFPNEIKERLRKEAEAVIEAPKIATGESDAQKIERLEKELSRMAEKHEQKLVGVMKKYAADVESLKNQVRALQKKLAG